MGSIHAYETAGGKRYRVQYRTPERDLTGKRGFRTKRDAELFLASVEVAKARGEFLDARDIDADARVGPAAAGIDQDYRIENVLAHLRSQSSRARL